MSKLKLIAVILLPALAGLPFRAAAEEPKPPAEQTPEERDAYLKELDQKLEKMKKHIQQMREEQQRQELAVPLAERALTKVTDGDYAGAAAALAEWGVVDPTDSRVAGLQALVRQMSEEGDEKRRTQLLREYLDAMVSRPPPAEKEEPAPPGEPVPVGS